MGSTERISALRTSLITKGDAHKPVPSLDDVMEDIHAENQFRVREFLVARKGGMNVLASLYHLESGGTVIDWELVRRAWKGKRI